MKLKTLLLIEQLLGYAGSSVDCRTYLSKACLAGVQVRPPSP